MARLMLFLCVIFLISAAPPAKYAEGQVWSYKTRPGDEASLLKIQKIEASEQGSIFHISIIGIRLKNTAMAPMLPHAPVSQQTLDASVTSLRPDPGTFPSAEAGIAEWRGAHGGVFTISVAEIVQAIDDMTAEQPAPTS